MIVIAPRAETQTIDTTFAVMADSPHNMHSFLNAADFAERAVLT